MKYFKPELEFIVMGSDVICSSPGGLDLNEGSEFEDAGNYDDLE